MRIYDYYEYFSQIFHQRVRCPRHRGDPQHRGGRAHGQVQLGQGERRPQQPPLEQPGNTTGNQWIR